MCVVWLCCHCHVAYSLSLVFSLPLTTPFIWHHEKEIQSTEIVKTIEWDIKVSIVCALQNLTGSSMSSGDFFNCFTNTVNSNRTFFCVFHSREVCIQSYIQSLVLFLNKADSLNKSVELMIKWPTYKDSHMLPSTGVTITCRKSHWKSPPLPCRLTFWNENKCSNTKSNKSRTRMNCMGFNMITKMQMFLFYEA